METSNSKIVDGDQKVANLFGQSSLATYCVSNIRNTVNIEYEEILLAIFGPLTCGIQTEAFQEITNGGAHYAIESSGVSQVVLQAIRSVRALGTIAVVGASGNLDFHIHDELIPLNKKLLEQAIQVMETGKTIKPVILFNN